VKHWIAFLIMLTLLASCTGGGATPGLSTATPAPATAAPLPQTPQPSRTPFLPASPSPSATVTQTPTPAPTPTPSRPAIEHILLVLFENHGYTEVIGREDLVNFNRLARENVLFSHYYAVAHPSLPNYIALIGGDTFGISNDCAACFLDQPSLVDRIEESGRSWKTYQEDIPAPCYVGFTDKYDLNHNPFLYFDAVRTDAERCQRSVVGLDALAADLANEQLPNYALIMPNLCHSAHNCGLEAADHWLGKLVAQLQGSPALGENTLLFILFDESSADNTTCCGLPGKGGGRIPLILISPLARAPQVVDTPLSHYSLLKTILNAWDLPGLGIAGDPATQAIDGVWK
jgi:phosphatidylinositol-3-phosphatase